MIKRKNALFLVAYVIYFSGLVIEHAASAYAPKMKALSALIAIFCLVLNFLKYHSNFLILRKRICLYVLLAAVAGLAVLARDFFVLVLLLFAVNLPDDDGLIKDLFKISILFTVLVCVLIVLLCFMGYIPNINTARNSTAGARWAYGFDHSQTLSLMFLYIVLYYYTYKQKISFISFMVFQMIGLFLSIFFDTRNSLYSIEMFFIIYILWKFACGVLRNCKRFVSETIYFISSYSTLGVAAVSFLLLWLYAKGNVVAIRADYFLTGRIKSPLKNFAAYPVKLIRIMSFQEYRGSLQSTMDNGYYYIVFRYGFLYLVLLCMIAWFIAKYFRSKKNLCGAISLIIISVSCAIANEFVGCYFYPFWMVAIYEIKSQLLKKAQCKRAIPSLPDAAMEQE